MVTVSYRLPLCQNKQTPSGKVKESNGGAAGPSDPAPPAAAAGKETKPTPQPVRNMDSEGETPAQATMAAPPPSQKQVASDSGGDDSAKENKDSGSSDEQQTKPNKKKGREISYHWGRNTYTYTYLYMKMINIKSIYLVPP